MNSKPIYITVQILSVLIEILIGLLCMSFSRCIFYSGLRSTALCSLALVFSAPLTAHAFNPYEGATPSVNRSTRTHLPPTTPLISPTPRLIFPDASAPRLVPQENSMLTAEPVASTRPKLAFPENTQARQAPAENLEAAAIGHTTATSHSFGAPAPLVAPLPETIGQAPVALGLPAALSALPSDPVLMASTPTTSSALSDDSKKILSAIPSKLDTSTQKGGKLAISRMSPDLQALAKNPKVESFDSGGLSIKVQRPGLDTNFELNRAYTSLMGGESSTAIDTYKNILSSEPNNEDALFGIASTYHRLGNLEQARPYYASLLKLNPNHREGLNNFLALISDESPQEALAELERLEQRNPDFSPIPAQQAILLTKLGYADRARDKMVRAIELAPDNLTYKYNLAIMMDKSGHYADASALYRLLIDAALNGQKIPASTASLQKRLNFIATVRTNTPTIGG